MQASAEIFQTLLAYKKSALLRTGIELGVFAQLAERPSTADDVAAALDVAPRGARLLLNALAAIDVVVESDGVFGLAPWAAETLDPAREGYLGQLSRILTSRWEWEAMGRLPEAVRRGGPVIAENAEDLDYGYYEEFATHAGAVTRPTVAVMAETLRPWASPQERLDVLDLACGHGMYGFTLAQQHPRARVWSVDNPRVLEIAQKRAARMGVADRVTAVPGDMFEMPLGGPYDLVLITNVLHHHTPQRATELLRRTAAVTRPGGRIVLVGITADDGPVRESPEAHLFSLLMLVWTDNGEAHSAGTYERMLAEAGYANMRLHRQPNIPMRVIVAERS